MNNIHHEPDPPLSLQSLVPHDRAGAMAFHMAALEELAEAATSGDGWTAFSRKLFLTVLAETGRVTTACDYCRLSKQSAYALRARDPIFAAGWDAACELARMPLADALYEQALDGLTDTITRDDGSKIVRHRHDSRLSIAVLNRLDRRCDRAAEQGSSHLGAVAQWTAFVAAIGADDVDGAAALLAPPDSAKLGQASQPALPPTPELERVWFDENAGQWRTDFPAPPGFDGKMTDEGSERTLTAAELDAVERSCDADEQAEREEDEAERDAFFAALRLDNDANGDDDAEERHPGPDPGSTVIPADKDETPMPPATTLRASAPPREPSSCTDKDGGQVDPGSGLSSISRRSGVTARDDECPSQSA